MFGVRNDGFREGAELQTRRCSITPLRFLVVRYRSAREDSTLDCWSIATKKNFRLLMSIDGLGILDQVVHVSVNVVSQVNEL